MTWGPLAEKGHMLHGTTRTLADHAAHTEHAAARGSRAARCGSCRPFWPVLGSGALAVSGHGNARLTEPRSGPPSPHTPTRVLTWEWPLVDMG